MEVNGQIYALPLPKSPCIGAWEGPRVGVDTVKISVCRSCSD